MIPNPDIIIITLNYNQSKMTLECLESVLHSEYNNFNLLVIDNGSTVDEYRELLNFQHPKLLVKRIQKNIGYVGGINTGLKEADKYSPDFYMIMNNDTIIDPKAIGYLIESAQRYSNNAIVTGKVYDFYEKNLIQDVGGILKNRDFLIVENIGNNKDDIGQFDIEEERDMIDDIFWLIPKKIYLEIGNYSDDFYIYAEQGDYARRALNRGFKLVFTPKAKIWHKGSVTTGNGEARPPHVNYWRNKGSIIYRAKHLKPVFFWRHSIRLLFVFFLKSINYGVQLKREGFLVNYAAFRGVLDGILWVFHKRKDFGDNPFIK